MYENVLAMSVAQQFEVARTTNDTELLHLFATNKKQPILQIAAAMNSATSEKDLNMLLQESQEAQAEAIAGNPATQKEDLKSLSFHANRFVRARALANPSTPIEEADFSNKVKQHENDWVVLFYVLKNPNVQEDFLQTIFEKLKDRKYGWETETRFFGGQSVLDVFTHLLEKHPNASKELEEKVVKMWIDSL